MFDIPNQPTAIHSFAHDFSEGVQNACLLLGGPQWLRRVNRLIDGVSIETVPSRRTLDGFRQILGLLRLENIHDFSRVEASYFLLIDPAAPYVEEICLLTEALEDALEDMATSRVKRERMV
ncbi:hypothetical protein [Pseudooceanicola nanhaiensis]|uniref:hypothetical protein n=1 Tax=Pseudooceanicola nanhaiensis TaxID=375761 RepID=UPI0035124542